MHITNKQSIHRKDIQGMRALAIFLVIAAHAKIPGLSVGFIGVDIFFVISGYLITQTLLLQYDDSGKISLLTFYSHRLQRLLPALLLMVISVSFIARYTLTLNEQTNQFSEATSALLWISNIYYAFTDTDYFNLSSDTNLYLHTWSLGVEEQFYLIWPIILLLFCRQSKPKYQLPIILILIVSFIACLITSKTHPNTAFYLTPFRMWQFILGALLCINSDLVRLAITKIKNTISTTGLLLIAAPLVLMDTTSTYPGLWATLPTIGTCFLIAGGIGKVNGLIQRGLSTGVLQVIGDMSYSLYLWHWPILFLGGIYFADSGLETQFKLIGISWMIAALSYYLVERPIRYNAVLRHNSQIAVPAFIFFLSIGIVSLSFWGSSAKSLLSNEENTLYASAKIDMPVLYSMGCDDWINSSEVVICSFGVETASKTAVLMGDSIAAQWVPALIKIFTVNDWKLLVITKSSCPMIDKTIFYKRIGRYYLECTEWRNKAISMLKQLKPNLLILGSSEAYDISVDDWKKYSERFLTKISKASDLIYLIRPTPLLPFDGPRCLTQNKQSIDTCKATVNTNKNTALWRATTNPLENYNNMRTVDMNDTICPLGECSAIHYGTVIYRDSQHLTSTYVEKLTPILQSKLEPYEN